MSMALGTNLWGVGGGGGTTKFKFPVPVPVVRKKDRKRSKKYRKKVEKCQIKSDIYNIFLDFQFADPQLRQEGQHVEFESKEWDYVFKVTSPLMTIAESLREWCRNDKASLEPIFK
jgi:hypothetical protein